MRASECSRREARIVGIPIIVSPISPVHTMRILRTALGGIGGLGALLRWAYHKVHRRQSCTAFFL